MARPKRGQTKAEATSVSVAAEQEDGIANEVKIPIVDVKATRKSGRKQSDSADDRVAMTEKTIKAKPTKKVEKKSKDANVEDIGTSVVEAKVTKKEGKEGKSNIEVVAEGVRGKTNKAAEHIDAIASNIVLPVVNDVKGTKKAGVKRSIDEVDNVEATNAKKVAIISSSNDTMIPMGVPTSGRVWKKREVERTSSVIRNGTPTLKGGSWEKKEAERKERLRVKELERHLKAEKVAAIKVRICLSVWMSLMLYMQCEVYQVYELHIV